MENLVGVLRPSQVLPPLRGHKGVRQPSAKQLAAIHYHNSGMSKRAAMIKAGYSGYTAGNPGKMLSRPSTKLALEVLETEMDKQGVTIEKMARKMAEWIDAQKIHGSMTEPDREVPDYETQLKAYDRWAKIKKIDEDVNKPKMKRQMTVTEFINDT